MDAAVPDDPAKAEELKSVPGLPISTSIDETELTLTGTSRVSCL